MKCIQNNDDRQLCFRTTDAEAAACVATRTHYYTNKKRWKEQGRLRSETSILEAVTQARQEREGEEARLAKRKEKARKRR